jgi:hypothetical protein
MQGYVHLNGIFPSDLDAMENPTFAAPATFDLLSDCRLPGDFGLLMQYSAWLLAEDIEWDQHALMLSSAKQFLHWWRKQFVGDEFQILDAAGSRPMPESAWHHLREAWLRHACPHGDLRAEQRTWMNGFLRFIAVGRQDSRLAQVQCQDQEGFGAPARSALEHTCPA